MEILSCRDQSPFCNLWCLQYIEAVYKVVRFFFLFCILDNAICIAVVGIKPPINADNAFMVI